MPTTRKNHPPSLKARVAVEALKGHKTTTQIAQTFGVHPTQVGSWKKQALAGLAEVFGHGPTTTPVGTGRGREGRALQTDRPTESGVGLSQKKSWAPSPEDRRVWIDPKHKN